MKWSIGCPGIVIIFLAFILFAALAKIDYDKRFDRKFEAFKLAHPHLVQMSETERNRAYDRFISHHPELEK
jgi:hypothetical protein